MFDTHCHLQFNIYKNNLNEVIKRCQERQAFLNIVGSQKDTSRAAVELAEKHNNYYATIGLHPVHLHATHIDEEESSFFSREESFDKDLYRELAKSKKVKGIGECGIDLFHIPEDVPTEKILDKQKQEFIKQIELAKELDLALVVHARNPEPAKENILPNAYDIVIQILKEQDIKNKNLRTVIHCYGGDWKQAQQFLDLGCYVGFTGIITFPARKTNPKPTENLLEVAQKIPLDRIVVETDAPYLAPQAYRGKQAEPWMIEEVAQKIGELRGLSQKEVLEITQKNALNLFKI